MSVSAFLAVKLTHSNIFDPFRCKSFQIESIKEPFHSHLLMWYFVLVVSSNFLNYTLEVRRVIEALALFTALFNYNCYHQPSSDF